MNKLENLENRLEKLEKQLNHRGYENLSFIGSGAFSCVYRIRHRESGQLLACKISENCRMAEREAELLQELTHPLFPRYVCHWKEEELCYLVMEYISGSSLQTLVKRRGGFSQKQTVRIGMELAAGVEFLHERSYPIIFRDIKPENIMIREDGRVKLVDVGCACRLDNDAMKVCEIVSNVEDRLVGGTGRSKGHILSGRTLAGSRGYAPPEQFSLEESPGRESDVYALGKLLQFLLFGEEMNKWDVDGKYRKIHRRKISKGLKQMLQQAVQEERQKRIPDMRTFQQKLMKYDEGKGRGKFQGLSPLHIEKKEAEFYYIKNVRKGF